MKQEKCTNITIFKTITMMITMVMMMTLIQCENDQYNNANNDGDADDATPV